MHLWLIRVRLVRPLHTGWECIRRRRPRAAMGVGRITSRVHGRRAPAGIWIIVRRLGRPPVGHVGRRSPGRWRTRCDHRRSSSLKAASLLVFDFDISSRRGAPTAPGRCSNRGIDTNDGLRMERRNQSQGCFIGAGGRSFKKSWDLGVVVCSRRGERTRPEMLRKQKCLGGSHVASPALLVGPGPMMLCVEIGLSVRPDNPDLGALPNQEGLWTAFPCSSFKRISALRCRGNTAC